MHTPLRLLSLLITAAIASACGDDNDTKPQNPEDTEKPARFVVRFSDYSSDVSFSLFDAKARLKKERFLSAKDQDTRTAAKVDGTYPLNTDSVVASGASSFDDQRVTVVSRKGGNLVTYYDTKNMKVISQLRLTDGKSDPNVMDALIVSENQAFVSRHTPPATDADKNNILALGNDVLEVTISATASTATTTKRRIDFTPFNKTIDGTLYIAHPNKLLYVNKTLVVGLDMLTADWMPGPGTLALVDPQTLSVTTIVLPANNCGQISPIPGKADQLIVTCMGDFKNRPGLKAGVLVVQVESPEKAEVIAKYIQGPDQPRPSSVAAISNTEFYMAAGVDGHDEILRVKLDAGATFDSLFKSKDPYAIGGIALDPESETLMFTDASKEASGIYVKTSTMSAPQRLPFNSVVPPRGVTLIP